MPLFLLGLEGFYLFVKNSLLVKLKIFKNGIVFFLRNNLLLLKLQI